MNASQYDTKYVCLLAGLVITATLTSGIIHGRGSRRWSTNEQLQRAGDELRKLSKSFGSWDMKSEETLADLVIETIECAGYVQRTYVNERGKEVRMAVLVGPPGPISVHIPEICYSSQNSTITEKTTIDISSSSDASSFWMLRFKPESLAATPFRVFYAFSEDGRTWHATENPRIVHGSASLLYKIQVVIDGEVRDHEPDPARDFLQAFLSRTGS